MMTSSTLPVLLGVLVALAAMYLLWALRQRRKLLQKIASSEAKNAALDDRIEKTKAHLLASENARRNLEVSNAIALERERIMREIHDGIGSGLVAALASAERHGRENSTAVHALKGALSDLKIAVDSLEPVEGNVATLLANLRYRLEPELNKSGIVFDWNVDDVPQLDWVDAPNALHVLRIFQEAIVNIVSHAEATVITLRCHLDLQQGRPGVLVSVSDNGKGFDVSKSGNGHGRKNMESRAQALASKLIVASTPGKGSSTTLWLPLVRGRSN